MKPLATWTFDQTGLVSTATAAARTTGEGVTASSEVADEGVTMDSTTSATFEVAAVATDSTFEATAAAADLTDLTRGALTRLGLTMAALVE